MLCLLIVLIFALCLLCYFFGKKQVEDCERILDEIIMDKSYSALSNESRQRLREKLSK
jgi:hypothetical protein